MAVFETLKFSDPVTADQLNRLQQNIAKAVSALSAPTSQSVVTVKGTYRVTGKEDTILVDASAATQDVQLLLPAPNQLSKPITITVTKSGTRAVVLKAVDVPSSTSPQIDGANTVTVKDSVTVVSTGTQFHLT